MAKGRILSGMRPTGRLHLGNLEGALRNWVNLQDEYECFFVSVNWHALTTGYEDTRELRALVRDNVIDWLSLGIDPQKSVVFVQSEVKQHAELYLLLGMLSGVGWLERCTTYKDWLDNGYEPNYGLLGYPVLQTADIVMYKADTVPVGRDQLQHLEMARELVRRFNRLYGEVLVEPQAKLTEFPYVPGIDGRKMSKSYRNEILIAEKPEVIQQKVRRFFTDPQKLRRGDPGRPEICPVFALHNIYTRTETEEIAAGCRRGALGCVECKGKLSQSLIETLAPARERRAQLERNPQEIEDILADGNRRAREVAEQTMQEVREAMKI
jgi:tryptophanyl-tRNA synthetase